VHKIAGDKFFCGWKTTTGCYWNGSLKSSCFAKLFKHRLFGVIQFFQERSSIKFKHLTDSIGKRFTIFVFNGCFSALFFGFFMIQQGMKCISAWGYVIYRNVPCAIALAYRLYLGNMLRILAKRKFLLKDTQTIEEISPIDTQFWQNSTLTTAKKVSGFLWKGSVKQRRKRHC